MLEDESWSPRAQSNRSAVARPKPSDGSRAAESVSEPRTNGWVFSLMALAFVSLVVLGLCSRPATTLRVVAGSGFSSFEPILKRWGEKNAVDVQVT